MYLFFSNKKDKDKKEEIMTEYNFIFLIEKRETRNMKKEMATFIEKKKIACTYLTLHAIHIQITKTIFK